MNAQSDKESICMIMKKQKVVNGDVEGKVKVDTYQNHFPYTVQIKPMPIIVGITSIYGTRKLI